jgi:hypothetical protein
MAAYACHHLLPFGNYMLYYFRRLVPDGSIRSPLPTPIWKLHVTLFSRSFPGEDGETKELGHEKLVTVILGPLSDRHWLYLYMEIVARRTRRTKATDTDLYIFISDGKHVFDCSVEQTDHSMEQRLSLACRGDLS